MALCTRQRSAHAAADTLRVGRPTLYSAGETCALRPASLFDSLPTISNLFRVDMDVFAHLGIVRN